MARRTHSHRGGRIGEEIKRIISDLLLRELKDPRFVGLVSVSAVKASDDGSFATVYVTMLGSGSGVSSEATEDEKQGVLAAFEKARGFIRHEIGQRLGIRHAPDLKFVFDTSEEYGRHIEKIIGELGIEHVPEEKPVNSVREIADALDAAETIRIFPHENMDGDTLGSAVALCLALRARGKDCAVVISEKIPDNIAFIEYGCTVDSRQPAPEGDALSEGYDLAILMDVGETERIPGRDDLFALADETMCFDHHVSSRMIYDYNYVDVAAAATGELVYEVLHAMEAVPDVRAATALYVGIVTDTGRFQYTNTTPHTHRVTAELLDIGVQPNEVSTEVYQNIRMEKILLETAVISTMETVADGRGVVAYMTNGMLAETGAIEEETEGIAEKLRGIRGVEVSVFVRETEDGRTKGSLRSKREYDVAELAARFGGGGHVRAAGFTSKDPLADVTEQVKRILAETL
jgi:phosphoesterase RecJ-like protein